MTHAPDDYALVIGINNYPHWNCGAKSLNGAVKDATDFRDWLVCANGGGLSPENAKLILSKDDPLGPRQYTVDDAFREIRKQSEGKTRRRFYFYFSGHGHSRAGSFQQQSLCLANWSPVDAGAALHLESYVKASVGCLKFSEAVFFLDCCRVRAVAPLGQQSELECGDPDTKNRYSAIIYGSDVYEPTYEGEVDGEVRGYLTAGLLQVLKEGTIELGDLLKRLRRVVPELAAPKEQTVRAVPADTEIYLGPPGPKPPSANYVAANGTDVTIRVRSNLTGPNNPEDEPPPPQVGDISILRDDQLVARGVGTVRTKLLPGRYQVRIDHAEASMTHDLDVGPAPLEPRLYDLPRRASATLLSSTIDKHEWLTDPVVAASRWDASRGGQAVFISLRPSSPGDTRHIAGGLSLTTPLRESDVVPSGNSLHRAEPGTAELHYYGLDGTSSSLPIPIAANWDTHVFILMTEGRPRLGTASISMRPAGVGFDPSDALIDAYERAIGDLVTGGPGPDQVTLDSLLLGKYRNPLFGLLGAHFLIRQMRRDAVPDANALGLLSIVTENLGNLLGKDAPDVSALRLWKQLITKSDALEAWPGRAPLFSVGFQAFVEASAGSARGGSAGLSQIALGLDASSPWTLWKQEMGADYVWGSHNHVEGLSTFHASSSSFEKIKVIEQLWRREGFAVTSTREEEKTKLNATRAGDVQFELTDQAWTILRIPDWLVDYMRQAIQQSRSKDTGVVAPQLDLPLLVRRTMLPLDVLLAAKSLADLQIEEETLNSLDADAADSQNGSAKDTDDGEALAEAM